MPTAAQISADLPGYFTISDVKGKELLYTIKSCALEEVGEAKDTKMVMGFKETPKKLVLNGARTEQLATLFGADTEVIGQKVKLIVDLVKVNNREMAMVCIVSPDA